jgi:hypothetical protein
MDSNAIFSNMFSELKTAFATSMVRVKSGLYEFDAMKTRIEKDGLLDEMSGRMDPEPVFARRFAGRKDKQNHFSKRRGPHYRRNQQGRGWRNCCL